MEYIQYIVEILGTTGVCVAICISVMKAQQAQNEKLLEFMLEQIKKQAEILDVIKEQLTIIKEDMDSLKEKEKGE